jgi:peptidoglycan/LPS O-acetylase OafA/YrhL
MNGTESSAPIHVLDDISGRYGGLAATSAPTEQPGRRVYFLVDLTRAAAAIVVVAEHVRAFVFMNFGETANPSWTWKPFYFVTGLGHDAVMVFFVLSGFLVGGHVYTSIVETKWSWAEYLVKRLSRLWVVLFPALMLTCVWDQIGIHLTHSSMYSGGLYDYYLSTPRPGEQDAIYSLSTSMWNLLFLQTLDLPYIGTVPTFGTNGPLWSLANEFWYYILFPLILIPLWSRDRAAASGFLMLAAAMIVCIALPRTMVFSGSIWLMGAAVYIFDRNVALPRTAYCAIGWISAALFGLTLFVTRTGEPGLRSDLLVGVTFSALLAALVRSASANGPIVAMSRHLANFSYTLYLTHFSLAALLACLVLKNRRLEPSPSAFLLFASAVVLLLIYSYGVSLLFENNTQAVQAYFLRRLRKRSPVADRVLSPSASG